MKHIIVELYQLLVRQVGTGIDCWKPVQTNFRSMKGIVTYVAKFFNRDLEYSVIIFRLAYDENIEIGYTADLEPVNIDDCIRQWTGEQPKEIERFLKYDK